MSPRGPRLAASILLAACLACTSLARAQEEPLPDPLDAKTVVRLARERRAEVAAARARARAAGERPKIVSALPDPMLAVTAEHLPFDFHGINGNVTLQQEFPLSGVRGNRRRVAEADAARYGAETGRVALDVSLEALEAFFMVAARRATAPVFDEQISITEQVVVIARAHLAAGQGGQADVLRLDNEVARLRSDRQALDPEIRSAEAMLDAALARDPGSSIPAIAWNDNTSEPPTLDALARRALATRPELAAARADRRRALAEIDTMQSMYGPMMLVRAGPSYMMGEGPGVMAMVGVSLPIWRERLGAGVAEAQSMATMVNEEIVAMERMISGDVAVARERVLAERIRVLALQQDILPRGRQVVSSATASFAAGQGPMLSVLDATRDLRDIRMQEIMARARLGTAWAKLERATGGL